MKNLLILILTLLLAAPLLAQAHSVDVPHSHGQFGQVFIDLLHAMSSLDQGLILGVGLVASLGLGLRRWLRAGRK
ncbi:hypothetical protein [Roseateles oligotrophus]|uniref:Uncharacterized protein n=1 Tax=Roseateles oligotrophus TaxID=1769250 RepID=A0ABT2YH60_9BURK|nr:hypothetical protein [Roseateles oligotrophus]MCV2369383.1 hypothetical protein [Roseateles oligotrophus]